MAHGRVERTATMLRAGGVFAAGIALLVIAGCIVAVGVMARTGDIKGSGDTPTFSTTASGTVEVPATGATTSVQLLGCGAGPGLALQQANGRLATMTKVWRTLNVPKDAIARGAVNTFQAGSKRWCTSVTAVATVHDLDLVDEVLTGIARTPRGIQSINGPTFDYDPAKLEEGALDEAMRVARRKADDAARRVGSRVVGVGDITVGETEVTRPEDVNVYNNYCTADRAMASNTAVTAKLQSYTTAVSRNPGKATASVSVEAAFRLEE